MSTPPVWQPDYNHVVAEVDRFLPQIHPVALALLDRLPEPATGAIVLDVSCGTGEPGLTLARRSPKIRLLGIDCAEAALAIARSKAAKEALTNARFEVMSSDALCRGRRPEACRGILCRAPLGVPTGVPRRRERHGSGRRPQDPRSEQEPSRDHLGQGHDAGAPPCREVMGRMRELRALGDAG